MRGSIGLLLYVAVMVLAGILKKIAEDKARHAPRTVVDGDEPYTVTLDDMLTEAPVQEWNAQEAVELVSTPASSEGSAGEFGSQDRQFLSEDGDWDWRDSEDDTEDVSEEVALVPRKLNLEQAIIMSEIIREPRAKRPWPGR